MTKMKRSTTEHNLANWISLHVARHFPALAANPIPGVWFTGSKIWSLCYGIPSPSANAKDWDIFALDELAATRLVTGMGWNLCPSFKTVHKRDGKIEPEVNAAHLPKLSASADAYNIPYSDGYCYLTPLGEIDVWVSGLGNVHDELRTYPSESHAHCRVAFSFTDGLVMLPNERAA